MTVRVNITLNEPEIERLLRSPDGDVARMVRRVADRTANLARGMAPVDNGPLRASIRVEMRYTGRQVKAWIYTPLEYGLYVHEGTGIYGPKGQMIRPKRGQYLVFESRNARTTAPGRGRMVFAREVRGVRPRRYLLNALRQASPWPVDDAVIYT
ncbi:HK97 gp10 family phage protein [Streptomyces sp. NPDC059278]|uniref:HK97 gp10 family phage protein n=1 Tax=Streptomyces sp. NPDC059278 TaxID=3346801 RepID=UPI0036C68FB4